MEEFWNEGNKEKWKYVIDNIFQKRGKGGLRVGHARGIAEIIIAQKETWFKGEAILHAQILNRLDSALTDYTQIKGHFSQKCNLTRVRETSFKVIVKWNVSWNVYYNAIYFITTETTDS